MRTSPFLKNNSDFEDVSKVQSCCISPSLAKSLERVDRRESLPFLAEAVFHVTVPNEFRHRAVQTTSCPNVAAEMTGSQRLTPVRMPDGAQGGGVLPSLRVQLSSCDKYSQ